jgi:hypothetical protein
MVQGPKEEAHFYRPRKPRESSFYQLVERFYPEFEKILCHCGLWDEDPARTPPPPEEWVEGCR